MKIYFNKIKNQNVVLDGYQFNSLSKKFIIFCKKLICIDERTNIFITVMLINNNPDFPESF